jgi:hypothetical protein
MITFNGLAQIGLFLAGYLLSPTILIWGWARWIRLPKQNTAAGVLSLCGFILATASALVAVSGMVYSFADWWFFVLRSSFDENYGSWRFAVASQLDLGSQWPVASESVALACSSFGNINIRVLDRCRSRGVKTQGSIVLIRRFGSGPRHFECYRDFAPTTPLRVENSILRTRLASSRCTIRPPH